MKIWILNRAIPDEYGEVYYQFFTAFKTVEGAKSYVESIERGNGEDWENAGYGWIKKCRIMKGYWEISSSYLYE